MSDHDATTTGDRNALSRSRGFDRRGDGSGPWRCRCEWASRVHGETCPEHGQSGTFIPPPPPPAPDADGATEPRCDIIGGFPTASPNCAGCGKPLLVENAWMTDGCPCNTPLGVNSMNETRWRLLMALQQQQARVIELQGKTIEAVWDAVAGKDGPQEKKQ